MHVSTENISQTMTDKVNIINAPNIMSHVGFRLTHLELTLTYSKGQPGRRNGLAKYFGLQVVSRIICTEINNIIYKINDCHNNSRLHSRRQHSVKSQLQHPLSIRTAQLWMFSRLHLFNLEFLTLFLAWAITATSRIHRNESEVWK